MKKITTVTDLRNNLLNELNLFYKSKTIKNLEKLDSVSKVSSTIIRTAKLEFEYNKNKNLIKTIDFLT